MTTVLSELLSVDQSGAVANILKDYRRRLAQYRGAVQGDPTALDTWAQQYRAAGQRTDATARDLTRTGSDLGANWQGQASDAFGARVGRLAPKLTEAQSILARQATALDHAAAALRTATTRMDQLIGAFEAAAKALVARSRSVFVLSPSSPMSDAFRLGSDAVRQADAVYQDLDRELGQVAEELRQAVPQAYASTSGAAPPVMSLPPAGANPQTVTTWWEGLSQEQRQAYINAYPQNVGALDGIPAADRDQANRAYLRQYLNDPANAKDPQYVASQALYDKIVRSPRQMYLLGIDPKAHDGRAIVSVGNPDTAAHTAVMVPGIQNELDEMPGLIARAERVNATASTMTDKSVAVVAWLGYDTPSGIFDTVGTKNAEAGAPALTNFVDGLRTTNVTDGGSHITQIGHSYGSVLTGVAAKSGNLHVDDIVVVGSPGMTVATAKDLRIDPNHVYVAADPRDIVANPKLYGDLVTAGTGAVGGLPGLAAGAALSSYGQDIHGIAPQDPSFGANVVDFRPAEYRGGTLEMPIKTHGLYWEPGEMSALKAQAQVVTGHGDAVPKVRRPAP